MGNQTNKETIVHDDFCENKDVYINLETILKNEDRKKIIFLEENMHLFKDKDKNEILNIINSKYSATITNRNYDAYGGCRFLKHCVSNHKTVWGFYVDKNGTILIACYPRST